MIAAASAIKFGIDPLAWEIWPRINIGPLSISPHGIGIAVGFLLGAQLMVRRSRRFGGPPEADIWNVLFYALIGAIIGARLGYVFGHLSEVTDGGDDLLGVFKVYEGGISLIGGITGAILLSLPYMFRKKMGFWRTMDLAAPGLALGIIIGRIGDLMIGDHLGKPTSFALGWHCLGQVGDGPATDVSQYENALRAGSPPSLGCYDVTLHQTALYDFFSTILLLALLLWVGKQVRKPGFMIILFTVWYATMRMITDFLRVDRRYFGLTGSQIMSLLVGLACLYLLVRFKGAPPRFAGPPQEGVPPPIEPLEGASQAAPEPTLSGSTTESEQRPGTERSGDDAP